MTATQDLIIWTALRQKQDPEKQSDFTDLWNKCSIWEPLQQSTLKTKKYPHVFEKKQKQKQRNPTNYIYSSFVN